MARSERPTDPSDPLVRTRLRRTAWWLAAVIAALFLGGACFILFNGHKSRTVLHSEIPDTIQTLAA